MKIKPYIEFINESKKYKSKEEIISALKYYRILDEDIEEKNFKHHFEISDDLKITSLKDIDFHDIKFKNKVFPMKIHIVKGSFNINNTNITSLKNCPDVVLGQFDCQWTNISSLDGSPEYVGQYFNCSNTKITSLKGAPKKVLGFNCDHCDIKNIDYFPQLIHKKLQNNIISMEACNLTDLMGLPNNLDIKLWLIKNYFKSLNGLPDRFDLNNIRFGNLSFSDVDNEKSYILANAEAIAKYIDEQLELDASLITFYEKHFKIVIEKCEWLNDKWGHLFNFDFYTKTLTK